MRVGRGRYDEFLANEWPPLKGVLLECLSKRRQADYQNAVEKAQLALKTKLAPTRKKLDAIIAADEGEPL